MRNPEFFYRSLEIDLFRTKQVFRNRLLDKDMIYESRKEFYFLINIGGVCPDVFVFISFGISMSVIHLQFMSVIIRTSYSIKLVPRNKNSYFFM